MRARIFVESGDCSPAAVDLAPGVTVTFGRSRDNVFVVRDDLVSRLHAKVYFEDGRWLMRDLGLNGTKVAGNKINAVIELNEGVELQVGHVKFRYTTNTGSMLAPATQTSVSSLTPPPMAAVTVGSSVGKDVTAVQPEYWATKAHQIVHHEQTPSTLIRIPTLGDEIPPTDTVLRADELTALAHYMATAVTMADAHELLRLTLRTVLNQTSAAVVGYLSLDPSEPTPKMVLPERVAVDVPLSRRLTERVRELRRPVWLFADEKLGIHPIGSLSSFHDAVCLPIAGADGEPLAALHAYRTGRAFADRDVKFLEAITGYLAPALESQRHRRKLEAENLRLRGTSAVAEELIGDSSAMMNLRQQIGRAAPMPFTVLIQGESGSGKELVALALHKRGPRASGPLVVVNCAAFAPAQFEAELFGSRKGAYPGAERDHPGLFEQADEGTLYLDEVADLSPECQAKLLRVIEGKSFRPVGGVKDIAVEVRVIAATSRDLEDEVRSGRFRQDLLFRLKVIPIRVPPLREHPEDIAELARFFLERLSVQCRRSLRLTASALQKLFAFPWSGNVRQLRAVLESAAAMSESDAIDADALPLAGFGESIPHRAPAPTDAPTSLDIDDIETWAIIKALGQTSGNVSRAARVLGISRDTLHTKLKKKNIDRVSAIAAGAIAAGAHAAAAQG